MEDVHGWTSGRRPQTSRATTVHLAPELGRHRGTNVAAPSYHDQLAQHQYRHQQQVLRSSRSASQLRQRANRQDSLSPYSNIGQDNTTPSVTDEDLLLLPPPPPYELRRAQSSSALSIGTTTTTTVTATSSQKDTSSSKWKTALGEAQFMAGGLIGRPAESTRHYTVIRHSSGLVWYKGPSTSISITILADEPLPPGRKIWLQEKGYSGNMGMSIKAFMGSRGNWIDVTPVQEAQPDHVPEMDERAIQRDIKRFTKKASGRLRKHVPRETCILRIPAAASDGYFRLIVCGGSRGDNISNGGGEESKKVLCGSPVFRIASTSTDAAVVRGASLSTMPLEMGVKVASTIGTQVARKYAGVAGVVVQSQAGRIMANSKVKKAATVAVKGYHGVGTRMQDAVQESWRRNRADGHSRLMEESLVTDPFQVIGSDDGPESPFPIKFDGRVSKSTGRSLAELGYPTANLKDVPDHVKTRLGGVFAAWVMIAPGKGVSESLSDTWHEAVVTIAPPRGAPPTVVMINCIDVYIAYAFGDDGDETRTFFDCRLKVLLMGYLHPAPPLAAAADDLIMQHEQDVLTTLASLGRDQWSADVIVSKMKMLKTERSFSDRLHQATGRVQQQVDRIPLHWAGMRSESGTLRDQLYGAGGMWIKRD